MNKKWIIWIVVALLALCCLGVVIGGVAFYFINRSAQANAAAAQAPLPVVRIFYPQNLDELPFGSVIPVGAEASVPEGNQVRLLQLWAGGEMIGEMQGERAALTASWGWVPSQDGEHTLVARAYNQQGGEATATIRVQVRRDLLDTDQDGVADEEDDCPDVVGAPEWQGCPPSAAGEIGDAWAPLGDTPSDTTMDAISEASEGAPPEAEDPPSEDPPVVESEEGPSPPPPMALLEVEGLNLVSAIGARDVYCYLTLTSRPLERVPSDAEGNFSETAAGNWNISNFLGGDHGRMVDVPEAGPLHLELDCWGHFSDDPLDPDVRHMGMISLDHGPADWDGREHNARGEMDANWFIFTYRICRGGCEGVTLPAPYGLTLLDMGANYELSWFWEGEPGVDNSNVGFRVYRDGVAIANIPDNHPFNAITLLTAEAEPPLCNQEYRFEVQAVRGADVQLSALSNPAWGVSSAPCAGENRVALEYSAPMQQSALMLVLEYFYTRSHTDRVMVGAYPLIGGAPADVFLFSWDGTSVGGGGGSTWATISYAGSEPITTDGLRLFMLTVHDGINPGGDMIYSRDVPFNFTWQPGVPDLQIAHLYYPQGDDILRIAVNNSGAVRIENWEPTFAFFQEVAGVRTRVAALDSPSGMAPVTIMPEDTFIVNWPGWTPAHFALLQPIFEVEVDPDNAVAEYNEENNVFSASMPNIQVRLQTVRVLAYGANDAAGFPGCFAGLGGYISIGPEQLYFAGAGKKATFPTFLDIYYPHEIGLMLCPPQEFDVETELIPALRAGSCTAACSDYFIAHGQPIFAEGEHTPAWWPPIPAWGTDYCSACYTLAGQTTVNRDTPILDVAYAGGDLEVHVALRDRDYLSSGGSLNHAICNFTGVIPAADMAALPIMNRTLTSPGGTCEIVVSIEPFP